MQNRAVLTGLFMLVVAAFCGSVTAEVVKVTREEEEAWLYHALPLPHRISIPEKLIIPPGGIAVCLSANAGPVERNAAGILKDFIKARTGVVWGLNLCRTRRWLSPEVTSWSATYGPFKLQSRFGWVRFGQ